MYSECDTLHQGLTGAQTTGRIKVWNSGQGVPVEMHKKENVYVPELIFGHLLTSSNYEDKQKKVWCKFCGKWSPSCLMRTRDFAACYTAWAACICVDKLSRLHAFLA